MMKEALSYFPMKTLPLYGLGIFIITFILVIWWVNRKGSDALYDQVSRLPLEDGEQQGVAK